MMYPYTGRTFWRVDMKNSRAASSPKLMIKKSLLSNFEITKANSSNEGTAPEMMYMIENL
jgi:hypothetical protein